MDSNLPPVNNLSGTTGVAKEPIPQPQPEKPKPRIAFLLLLSLIILTLGLGNFLISQKYLPAKNASNISLLPTISPTPVSSPDPLTGWKTYVNTLHQYSLKYPLAWKTRVIGAGIGGKEAKSDSNGLDISEIGVKRTYPYGVFTIQGFARSTESNYGLWKKSAILLGTTEANKYEYLNRKDLKSIAIVIKTPNDKYLEILFRETPDSPNWAVFNQILSTFYYLDYLDPTGWNVYKNVKYEYQISYPTDIKIIKEFDDQYNKSVSFAGKDTSFEVSLGREEIADLNALETYFYMDNPIARTTTLGGIKANIYEFPNGYCDGGQPCSKPFITYVALNNKRYFILRFIGDTQMSEAELLILSTFQFTK